MKVKSYVNSPIIVIRKVSAKLLIELLSTVHGQSKFFSRANFTPSQGISQIVIINDLPSSFISRLKDNPEILQDLKQSQENSKAKKYWSYPEFEEKNSGMKVRSVGDDISNFPDPNEYLIGFPSTA